MKASEIPRLKDFTVEVEKESRGSKQVCFASAFGPENDTYFTRNRGFGMDLYIQGRDCEKEVEAERDATIYRKSIVAMLRTMREECRSH